MTAPIALRTLLAGALIGALTLPALAAPTTPPMRKPSPYPSAGDNVAPVELVEDVEGLKINWSTGRMTVSGIGVPGDRGNMAYRRALSSRAATADAYRRFAGALDMVRVDTNTRVKDLAVVDDTLRTRLSDFIKSAKVLETNYWPDGSAEVVLGADLRGATSLAGLIAKNAAQPVASAAPSPTPEPMPSKEVVTEPVPIRSAYSSLIIEAKGLGAQPAILPNVRDAEGKVIDLSVGANRRPVKYLRDGAFLDNAAGLNPLKTTATRTQGTLRADLVLSPADSKALKASLLEKKLADDAAIIVVL
jgi:hypothetical protein